MDNGRSTVERFITKEINELKSILDALTITNENLKKINLQGEVGSNERVYH